MSPQFVKHPNSLGTPKRSSSISGDEDVDIESMMSPEERKKKVKGFIKTHTEARRRSAVSDYILSGVTIGGLLGYLAKDSAHHTPIKSILIGGGLGAIFGGAFAQCVVPWVAQSEAQAITDGDELGIKTYGYSEFIDRDNIGIPGSNLISNLITGKLLFGT